MPLVPPCEYYLAAWGEYSPSKIVSHRNETLGQNAAFNVPISNTESARRFVGNSCKLVTKYTFEAECAVLLTQITQPMG